MTYKTNKTNRTNRMELIPAHGGYRQLKSYQTTTIIYDLTVEFCKTYMTYKTNKSYRTIDQMIQAARSGKQNIAEGSQASATSKKTEIKLVGVARASLEELLLDFEDFLRQSNLPIWGKDHPKAQEIRALSYMTNRTHMTYMTYFKNPESAANCLICLIHQANYLLDKQLEALEKDFLEKGGFTERLFRKRLEKRKLIGLIGLIGLMGLISPTASANSDYLLQNSTINIFLNEPKTKTQVTPSPSYKIETDSDSFLSVSLLNTIIDFGIISPLSPVTRTHDLEVKGSKELGYSAFVQGSTLTNQKDQSFSIPHTSCDQGLCSGTTAAPWTSVLTYGFGFRCDNLEGENCSSDFKQDNYRKIPNFADGFAKRLSFVQGLTLSKARITYKVNVAKAQEKGVYQSEIMYIVLPNF